VEVDFLALLNADVKCPPHEVGQALPNPSPQEEGSQNSRSLSFGERARVRVNLEEVYPPVQQRRYFYPSSSVRKS